MQADVDLSRSNYLKTNQELSELQKEAANMMMILGRVNQETGKLFLRVMNLFGHIHEKGKIKEYGFNVGVDANCFLPVPPEDVKFYIHAILHYYDNNVFN